MASQFGNGFSESLNTYNKSVYMEKHLKEDTSSKQLCNYKSTSSDPSKEYLSQQLSHKFSKVSGIGDSNEH